MIELDIECTPASASLDIKRVERLCHALEQKDALMADVRKHLGLHAKTQNKVPIPSMVNRFTHTRNVTRSSEKYFTTGRNIPFECQRDVANEENPFKCSDDADEILSIVFPNKESGNKSPPLKRRCFFRKYCDKSCTCQNKDLPEGQKCSLDSGEPQKRKKRLFSFRSKNFSCNQVNPILARLQVPEDPLPRCKTDVDKEYFTIIRGRPVKETFNRHDFSKYQRKAFFDSVFVGYFEDEVKKRREHYRLDVWQLEQTSEELDKVKAALEAFANEHHSESVKIVTEQMHLNKIRDQKADELRRCKGYVNAIKSSLYKKDDVLATSMYCRDILLKLSSTQFRASYEQEVQKFRTQTKETAKEVLRLFRDYCRYNPDPEPDLFLDELVSTFIRQILALGPPLIYFKHKWQLEMVFRKMELHCMEQLVDLNRLQKANDEIDRIAKDVKGYYSSQIDVVEQEIYKYEKNSAYEQQRAFELESNTEEVLEANFREVVCGDVVLEIVALIQVLYDDMLGPSNAKFDPCEMMVQIEEELRNVELQIEGMGPATMGEVLNVRCGEQMMLDFSLSGSHSVLPRYRRYQKKVEDRMDKEIKDANTAKAKDRDIRLSIQRVRNIHTKPVYGPGWRRPVQRSEPWQSTAQCKVKTNNSEDKKCRHLQIDGICDREYVETEIGGYLNVFGRQSEDMDAQDQNQRKSSEPRAERFDWELSTVSSSSVLGAISQLYSNPDPGDDQTSRSLSVIQLGYDSEEELLRLNYERRKLRGEIVEEPPVLYDVKSIDSNFMVTNTGRTKSGVVPKDRRHHHRKPTKTRTNPISWR